MGVEGEELLGLRASSGVKGTKVGAGRLTNGGAL